MTELGKGPAISFRDGSVICDRRLVKLFSQAAESEGIPYQYKRGAVGGTDAGALHLVREGVPAVVLSGALPLSACPGEPGESAGF